mgnify:FL=1
MMVGLERSASAKVNSAAAGLGPPLRNRTASQLAVCGWKNTKKNQTTHVRPRHKFDTLLVVARDQLR